MVERHWDSSGKYEKGHLKEFKHWVLEVSYRQHTLGCYIIFAKKKLEQFSDLNEEELIELPKVMKEIEGALASSFSPDRFNYLQLGKILYTTFIFMEFLAMLLLEIFMVKNGKTLIGEVNQFGQGLMFLIL